MPDNDKKIGNKVPVRCPLFKLRDKAVAEEKSLEVICENVNQWDGSCMKGLTDYCVLENAKNGILQAISVEKVYTAEEAIDIIMNYGNDVGGKLPEEKEKILRNDLEKAFGL